MEDRAEDAVMGTEMEENNDTVEKIKRQKASVATGSSSAPNSKVLSNLNLPIPSANGRACIVKICDIADGEIKLHDLMEFVGVVSLDPALSVPEEEEASMSTSPALPPPSLVPRLHVLT